MIRILVIDDDRTSLLLYETVLRKEGYDVVVATSGPEGLKHLRSQRPDLVVLDISMPGMDGLEVLARIMSIDRRVPIVLNSGYPSYKNNFLSWAADAYVLKSSDPTELKRTINDLLQYRTSKGRDLSAMRPDGSPYV
jgi:CheY-like chemotaxis protein